MIPQQTKKKIVFFMGIGLLLLLICVHTTPAIRPPDLSKVRPFFTYDQGSISVEGLMYSESLTGAYAEFPSIDKKYRSLFNHPLPAPIPSEISMSELTSEQPIAVPDEPPINYPYGTAIYTESGDMSSSQFSSSLLSLNYGVVGSSNLLRFEGSSIFEHRAIDGTVYENLGTPYQLAQTTAYFCQPPQNPNIPPAPGNVVFSIPFSITRTATVTLYADLSGTLTVLDEGNIPQNEFRTAVSSLSFHIRPINTQNSQCIQSISPSIDHSRDSLFIGIVHPSQNFDQTSSASSPMQLTPGSYSLEVTYHSASGHNLLNYLTAFPYYYLPSNYYINNRYVNYHDSFMISLYAE